MSTGSSAGSTLPFASIILLAALGNFFLLSPPLDSYRPEINAEERFGNKAAEKASARLWQDPVKAAELDCVSNNCSPSEIGKTIISSDDETTKIITIVLPDGEFAEMEERRKRRRYATIAALISSEYMPRARNSIAYFVSCKPDSKTKAQQGKCSEEEIIPYEIFEKTVDVRRKEDNPGTKKIIVVWMNERYLYEKPVKNINRIITKFFKSDLNPDDKRHTVIGPASSGELIEVLKEKNDEPLFDRMISPVATAPDEQIEKFSDQTLKQAAPFVERTIPQDNELVNLLATDLVKRLGKIEEQQIVIVSEMDSVYSRTFPDLMDSELEKVITGVEDKSDTGSSFNYIQNFGYFRGIDGRTVSVSKKDKGGQKAEGETNSNAKVVIEKPIGDAQFDYLRRLSDKIRQQKKRIKAIGVFGNDVYDKLLIIRALRKNFPTTLFFTTDLDARLLHPEEYKYTRNMLIASGFGLEPGVEQTAAGVQSPPFRDSYQTSIYNAVKLALSQEIQGQKIRPELFEVGRKGAYVVNHDNNVDKTHRGVFNSISYLIGLKDESEVSKADLAKVEISLKYLLVILISFGILLFFQSKLRESFRSPKLWVIFSFVFFLLLYMYMVFWSSGREPVSLFDGVSAWPGMFIRLLVVTLSVYYFLKAVCLINESNNSITFSLLENQSNNNIVMEQIGNIMGIKPSKSGVYTRYPYALLKFKKQYRAIKDNWFGRRLKDIVRMYSSSNHLVWFSMFVLFLLLLMVSINNTTVDEDRQFKMLSFVAVCMIYVGIFLYKLAEGKDKHNDKSHVEKNVYVILVCCVFVAIWFSYYVFLYTEHRGFGNIQEYYLHYSLGILLWFYVSWKMNSSTELKKDEQEILGNLKKTSVRALWYYYMYEGRCYRRIVRVMTYTLLYSVFTSTIFSIVVSGSTAVWADGSDKEVYNWMLRASIFCTTFLIFYVVDVIDYNNKWMQDFQEIIKDRDWTETDTLNESWKYMKVIADRSKIVSQLVYYPFIVVLLMLTARLTYFDNWGFPTPLLMVLGINFGMIFYLGYRLRVKSENLRQEIVVKLENELITSQKEIAIHAQKNNPDEVVRREHRASYIESLVEDIRGINYGAFGPFWDQPILKGAVFVLGGLSITISEYMVLFD